MKLSKNVNNKKWAHKWYSSMKCFFRMIRILFDIENWLWKSEFCTFWQLLLKWPQYYWPWRPVEINFQFSIHNMISADSRDSSELLRSAHCIVINDMSHTKDSLTFDVMKVWHPMLFLTFWYCFSSVFRSYVSHIACFIFTFL